MVGREWRWREQPTEINALAWLLWLAGVACVPLVSRNPLYLTLDLLVVAAVYLSLPRRGAAARAWRLFALVGTTLAVLSVGFNVLTVHVGDRVFATLPGELPIVGGPLTYNALVYGLLSALAIGTLLVGATAFNTAVRHADLIRLLPAGFAGLGVAGSIALTMIPQTFAAGRDIIDAQHARGHRFRGLRDARGLLVPLLSTGLERALTLSEALEARGFGASATAPRGAARSRWAAGGAAGLLVVALVALGLGRLTPGVFLLAGATALALAASSRGRRRTRLRPLAWNDASLLVATAALLALCLLMGGAMLGIDLTYDPFPRLDSPPFHPLAGAAIVLLIAPLYGTAA
jgi:energy-coupling factor transport system permease protein